jgi:hypothetical protein
MFAKISFHMLSHVFILFEVDHAAVSSSELDIYISIISISLFGLVNVVWF